MYSTVVELITHTQRKFRNTATVKTSYYYTLHWVVTKLLSYIQLHLILDSSFPSVLYLAKSKSNRTAHSPNTRNLALTG